MFIYCIDEQLKEDLIKRGFKILKQDKNGTIFALNKELKFDFSNVDKKKYLFTNKLTF